MATSIFITGANSPIGSAVIALLLKDDVKIKALFQQESEIRQAEKNFQLFSDHSKADDLFKIEWVQGDILDQVFLLECMENIDVVYHCLSSKASSRKRMLDANIEGTACMVNAAEIKGIKKFCYVSSTLSLGETKDGTLIDETTYWTPSKSNSQYGISMFYAEMEVWRGIQEGLDSVIINPSHIIFPNDSSSAKYSFPEEFTTSKNYYPLGGNGFVDIRDVALCMKSIIPEKNWNNMKNQRFILCAENLSYKNYFTRRANLLGIGHSPKALTRHLARTLVAKSICQTIFSRKAPRLAMGNFAFANRDLKYDGTKITQTISFSYRPIDETLAFANDISSRNQEVEQLQK